MALIAHWPLNGDILDYSGNGFHLTNNGATINNEGKIGKCYEFLNSNQYLDTKIQNQINSDNFCISFWVYIKEQNCQKYIFGNNLGDNQRLAFSLFDNYFSLSYGNMGWGNKIFNYELNKWYNIIINCKEDLKIFINNEFKYSIKSQKFLFPSFLKIGGRKDTINSPLIKINDFKIFNHELSKKEIKKLYQTKILDWKFNECEEPTINLLEINKQTKFNEVNTHLTSDNKLKFESVIEQGSLYNKVLKLTVLEDLGEIDSYPSLPTGVINGFTGSRKIDLIPGKKYTLTYRYKTKNYQKGLIAIWSHSRRLDGTTYSTDISGLLDTKGEWKIFKYNFTCPNDVNGRHFNVAGIRKNNQGFEYYVDWMQLEEKEYDTEYTVKERKGKVIDSSGYKNHGLIELNSSPKWLSSKKYEFNGTNLITLNKKILNNEQQDWTLITKINLSENIQPVSYINNFNLGTRIIHNSSEYALNYINSATNDMYVYSYSSIPKNKEIEVCFSYSFLKNEIKFYINGELSLGNKILNNIELTKIPNGIPQLIKFFENFKGTSSYLKIFAIQLSDSDIKELYENQLTIDKNNNINCNEIIEEKNLLNTNIIIKKSKEYNLNNEISILKYENKLSLKLKANAFHNGEYLNIFEDQYFKVNTQYEFNFNVNSNLIYQNNEVPGGFRIFYTDKSITEFTFQTSGTWQKRKIISNINKTIEKVCIYYYIGDPFYLDIESSYIKEYKQITNFINKQGILYKEINEIDYIDTVKINKNNEILCNTISEV